MEKNFKVKSGTLKDFNGQVGLTFEPKINSGMKSWSMYNFQGRILQGFRGFKLGLTPPDGRTISIYRNYSIRSRPSIILSRYKKFPRLVLEVN